MAGAVLTSPAATGEVLYSKMLYPLYSKGINSFAWTSAAVRVILIGRLSCMTRSSETWDHSTRVENHFLVISNDLLSVNGHYAMCHVRDKERHEDLVVAMFTDNLPGWFD